MEADSTTYDDGQSTSEIFPFPVSERNLQYYTENFNNIQSKDYYVLLVLQLQKLGLIPVSMECPTKGPHCYMNCDRANTRDKVKWACRSCKSYVSIRNRTIFEKLNCSLIQFMQLIMAWCEDVDLEAAASYFFVEPALVNKILLKLNDVATEALSRHALGGPNSVVLMEMYPHCASELSPDSTVQSHSHQILMMADTNHVPTRYHLHVIKNTHLPTRTMMTQSIRTQILREEISQVIRQVCHPASLLVRGQHVEADVGTSMATVSEYADDSMQQFYSRRLWMQAVTLCSASQDFCSKHYTPIVCAQVMQRYLSASLFRLEHADALFEAILKAIAVSESSVKCK